jgi:hypothetical protein
MFKLVELAAREDYDALGTYPWWDDDGVDAADRWADALDPLFVEQGDDAIGIDSAARSSSFLTIMEPGHPIPNLGDTAIVGGPRDLPASLTRNLRPHSTSNFANDDGTLAAGYWLLRQVLDDTDQHHDYAITALVDLAASNATEQVQLTILQVGATEGVA